MSYQFRSVPSLSTIEMSPGFDFTNPKKKPGFEFVCIPVSRDDVLPERTDEVVWGMGARGKGSRLVPRSSVQKLR
jgi:hypothetical protein